MFTPALSILPKVEIASRAAQTLNTAGPKRARSLHALPRPPAALSILGLWRGIVLAHLIVKRLG
jgi:hypothetical protein